MDRDIIEIRNVGALRKPVRGNLMKYNITLNGKPLSHYSDDEIAYAMAKETQEELTTEEQEAIDGATD